MNIDIAKANFEDYKANVEIYKNEHLTESDTRSKLLDELFIKVLGWSESDIKREGHTEQGYYDYLVSLPNFKFIIEAKKSFVEFKLPKKHKIVSFGTIYKENIDVIKQLRGYLLEVGLQYGIITNGKQFIVGRFLTSDGSPWTSNKCLIFNDIDDIENRFVEFYNYLSKTTVVENVGFEFLKEEKTNAQIVISTISGRDGELIRNSLSSKLTPLINELFGEIYRYDELDDITLIEKCFVENDEIKKNKSDIEKLFADRPPQLTGVSQARNTASLVREITQEMETDFISIKNIEPPKPIIIVGSKGAGKTTFINYLFKLSFDNEFLKRRPYVHIDFRSYNENDFLNLESKVVADALNYLYDAYPTYELYSNKVLIRVYISDIRKKDASTWAYNKANDIKAYHQVLNDYLEEKQRDNLNHFIKLSEYLIRERGLRLCIIIDNADQFDMDVQRVAFLFAQSINRKAKCAVIISLREGYYYAWRNKPPFDAFASNVYHVTAPPYKDVLQKRIEFALENIDLEGRTVGNISDSNSIRVDLGNSAVKSFLLSVKKSLFDSTNSEMMDFLQETTYPNIREGLEVFKTFLLSGHTNVDQYVLRQKAEDSSKNPVPIWEFVKAVALENKKYYNHNISRIINIFYPVEGSSSHFLKLKILYYLKSQLDQYGYKEKFTSVQQIIDDFSKVNYKPNVIFSELNALLNYSLIEDEDSSSDRNLSNDVSIKDSLSISLKGNYYINILVSSFYYIDLVLQDTPIFSHEYYSQIKGSFPLIEMNGKRNIVKRRLNVLAFIEYLKHREQLENVDSSIVPTNIMETVLANGLNGELLNVYNVRQYE